MPIYQPTVIVAEERVYIHPTARFDAFCKVEGGEGVQIGLNVHVASFCHINAGGGRVTLMDHCGLASHVIVCGGVTDITRLYITPQDGGKATRLETVVESYALLFAGVIVLPGVSIGMGAVIGAGAVVTRDVPSWEVWAGNPARKIGFRDAALTEWMHYGEHGERQFA